MDYCNFLAAQKDLLQANSILETLAPDDAPAIQPHTFSAPSGTRTC
jgi:hypothetical protein